MNFSVETMTQVMPGAVGKEILKALWRANWNAHRITSVDELGVSLGSHPGNVRSRNEDRLAVAQVLSRNGEIYTIALVCDGVGGSEMGDAAATLTVASFISEMANLKFVGPLVSSVSKALRQTDELVRLELSGRGATTASIVVVSSSGEFSAVNVGDSRIFDWRASKDLRQVSVDDTLENELKDLSINDPSMLNAKGLRGSLSQAIGETGRTSSDLRIVQLPQEEFLGGIILATDGAWKGSSDGFAAIARHSNTAADTVRKVLAFSSWVGGYDNSSLICIEDVGALLADCRSKFAESRNDLPNVVVWSGDGKIIFSESSRGFYKGKTAPEEISKKFDSIERKSGRKAGAGKKRVIIAESSKQMDLVGDEKPKAERPADLRPRVSISTDESAD